MLTLVVTSAVNVREMMITNPWRRALCWHSFKDVDNALYEGHQLLRCLWCYKIEKGVRMSVGDIQECNRKLGERDWNDIEGEDFAFLDKFPFYAELAGPVNWYLNVYDGQGEMYFLHLEEILNYAVESAISQHANIGQDGYFSMSGIKENMECNIALAEMLEAAAKDLRNIASQTEQIHG